MTEWCWMYMVQHYSLNSAKMLPFLSLSFVNICVLWNDWVIILVVFGTVTVLETPMSLDSAMVSYSLNLSWSLVAVWMVSVYRSRVLTAAAAVSKTVSNTAQCSVCQHQWLKYSTYSRGRRFDLHQCTETWTVRLPAVLCAQDTQPATVNGCVATCHTARSSLGGVPISWAHCIKCKPHQSGHSLLLLCKVALLPLWFVCPGLYIIDMLLIIYKLPVA